LGITFSPGVYFFLVSFFSCSVRALLGFACRYISSNVVTVAFGLVSLTEARHDGQVNGFGFEGVACEACHENHSLRQDPQKVCKQSRRVRGW
jgi:hypothetical protein